MKWPSRFTSLVTRFGAAKVDAIKHGRRAAPGTFLPSFLSHHIHTLSARASVLPFTPFLLPPSFFGPSFPPSSLSFFLFSHRSNRTSFILFSPIIPSFLSSVLPSFLLVLAVSGDMLTGKSSLSNAIAGNPVAFFSSIT